MSVLGRGAIGVNFDTGSLIVGLGGETTELVVGVPGQVLTVVQVGVSPPYLAWTNVAGVNMFVQLTDGPHTITQNAILTGGASSLAWSPVPNTANTVLEWNGTSYQWTALTGVNHFVQLLDAPATINANSIVVGNAGGSALAYITAPVTSNTFLTWNGSNFVWVASPGGATMFTQLTDVPATVTANGLVVGNGAGNALVYVTAPSLAGTYLSWNGSAFTWVPSAGATVFTGLLDVPHSYIPDAVVVTNNAANGLNFTPTASGSSTVLFWNGSAFIWKNFSITQLVDGPASIVADGVLVGNGAGTSVVFTAAPTVSNTYLQWNGSAFVWSSASIVGAFGSTVGQVTVTFGVGGITAVGTTTAGWTASVQSASAIQVVTNTGMMPSLIQWVGNSATYGATLKSQPPAQGVYGGPTPVAGTFYVNGIAASDVQADVGNTAIMYVYFPG